MLGHRSCRPVRVVEILMIGLGGDIRASIRGYVVVIFASEITLPLGGRSGFFLRGIVGSSIGGCLLRRRSIFLRWTRS